MIDEVDPFGYFQEDREADELRDQDALDRVRERGGALAYCERVRPARVDPVEATLYPTTSRRVIAWPSDEAPAPIGVGRAHDQGDVTP